MTEMKIKHKGPLCPHQPELTVYDGPEGVFYFPRADSIFTIENKTYGEFKRANDGLSMGILPLFDIASEGEGFYLFKKPVMFDDSIVFLGEL